MGSESVNLVSIEEEPNTEVEKISRQKRKPAFRFNAAADVALLKEVISEEPYAAPHGDTNKRWEKVIHGLGGKYSVETARKRVSSLVAEFKSKNAEQIKSSGTEEEYDERSQLLQDLVERMNDSQSKSTKKGKSLVDEKATEIRDEAMRTRANTVKEPTDIEGAIEQKRKRSRDDRLLDIMEEELRLKKRQQDIDETKLKLDEEKWKLEKEEKLALMELFKNK